MNWPIMEEPQEIELIDMQDKENQLFFYYYVVYLHELKFGLGIDNEPVSFSQATKSDNFIK